MLGLASDSPQIVRRQCSDSVRGQSEEFEQSSDCPRTVLGLISDCPRTVLGLISDSDFEIWLEVQPKKVRIQSEFSPRTV